MYESLKQFLNSRTSICENIKEYINKYLTVYYNYHIKHARIADVNEQSMILTQENDAIKKSVSPLNEVADTICLLNGSMIEIPKLTPNDGDREDALSMKKYLERTVKKDAKTDVKCDDERIQPVSPWAKTIVFNRGNMNSGGGR